MGWISSAPTTPTLATSPVGLERTLGVAQLLGFCCRGGDVDGQGRQQEQKGGVIREAAKYSARLVRPAETQNSPISKHKCFNTLQSPRFPSQLVTVYSLPVVVCYPPLDGNPHASGSGCLLCVRSRPRVITGRRCDAPFSSGAAADRGHQCGSPVSVIDRVNPFAFSQQEVALSPGWRGAHQLFRPCATRLIFVASGLDSSIASVAATSHKDGRGEAQGTLPVKDRSLAGWLID